MKTLGKEACSLYLNGLEKLKLPTTYIPTYQEMNRILQSFTNWRIVPTTELITSSNYFNMLANCEFPAITTIRPLNEIDYYTNAKPDVIHEFFGHAPFLINADYANFMQRLAKLALTYSIEEQILFGRLFWFTIEFGLIQTVDGLRVYGAGIIPSESETKYALYDANVERREFNLIDILRTPYSAIRKQKVYYIITSFDDLFAISYADLSYDLSRAVQLGSFSK
jgi:phenylalanine-4-hydroxylase